MEFKVDKKYISSPSGNIVTVVWFDDLGALFKHTDGTRFWLPNLSASKMLKEYVPPPVKRTGFVAIIEDAHQDSQLANRRVHSGRMFPSKAAAKDYFGPRKDIIAIVPVTWEEPAE